METNDVVLVRLLHRRHWGILDNADLVLYCFRLDVRIVESGRDDLLHLSARKILLY